MKELAQTNAAEIQTQQSTNIIQVIERAALNPDVDIDKMERLLDMQERILSRNAEMSYNVSMSALQSELPTITENGQIEVNGTVRSKYAKFEDINRAIKPLLLAHGFSITFKSDFPEKMLHITGVIKHKDGHQESTTMELPFDNSGSKNTVQAIGSSVSYGKRYVLCMLLNISTGGEDNDGNGAPSAVTTQQRQYPLDQFNTNFPKWEKAIKAGKKTPQALINMIESKGALTIEQKAKIHSTGGKQ